MNANEDLPSAGMDPFKQSSPRPGSCLSWGLVITGGLLSLFGCAMAYAATSIQFDVQEDWEGFYAFLFLCPLPCVLLGIVVLIAGALPLAKRNQIENA